MCRDLGSHGKRPNNHAAPRDVDDPERLLATTRILEALQSDAADALSPPPSLADTAILAVVIEHGDEPEGSVEGAIAAVAGAAPIGRRVVATCRPPKQRAASGWQVVSRPRWTAPEAARRAMEAVEADGGVVDVVVVVEPHRTGITRAQLDAALAASAHAQGYGSPRVTFPLPGVAMLLASDARLGRWRAPAPEPKRPPYGLTRSS